ncbi:MAG: tRNA lysidine(34) synthetase TilS [Nitrospirae bacterium]|jgi:tRNA(Ile)-lysidine synthase|nr:tRNA lysidine(34) synthetase TilS [Nitrospirota bacterium]
MLSGGEKVIVGLSGGPDSACLLYVLNNLKGRFKLTLNALYIDHGLRPEETPEESEFCRKFCERLNVPFMTKSIDVQAYAKNYGINKQEAARQLRYRAFEETASEIKADRIALGHTSDDQAETLLMRLLRGSGPTGLAGIPPVRGNIIRPLIDIERKDIEKILYDSSIDFIIDSSNLKRDYLRNKIRHSVMPVLKEFNPDIIKTLSKTASIFRDEERYFEIIVTKTLMKLISRKTDRRIELFLTPFEIMDRVIMRRVLRRAIDVTSGLRGISFIHIEDMIDLIKEGNPGDRLYLPKVIRVIKEYSTLVITSEPPVRLGNYTLTVPGETILKEAGILIKASIIEGEEIKEIKKGISGLWKTTAILDADRMVFPLSVRARKNGDFFYPYGFGRRKKLQDFFVDGKVPRDERDRVPLLISGEDIVWVVGYRGDERFKVLEGIKRVLKLEMKKIRD